MSAFAPSAASVTCGNPKMVDEIVAQRSIQHRLLKLLAVVMLIVVACAAAVSYFLALSVAQSAYDRSLLDPAFDIAANIRVGPSGAELDMLAQVQEALLYDREDVVVFQVRDPHGAVIGGSPALPAPPPLQKGTPTFFDSTLDGHGLRVAAMLSSTGYSVQVGGTLNKRNRLIREILAAEVV